MADSSEENPSTQELSKKAAIFESIKKLKLWREDQRNQFKNMQLLEYQKLKQLGENGNIFEKLLQNAVKSPELGNEEKDAHVESSPVSAISSRTDLDCYNLQDSSISRHLKNCFDDSSQSSISTSKIRTDFGENSILVTDSGSNEYIQKNEPQNKDMGISTANMPLSKPKRPFLRKGSGLLRYMQKSTGGQANKYRLPPKSDSNFSKEQLKKNTRLPQKTLKLKPAIRKTDIPSDHNKHIRFDIPKESDVFNVEFIEETDLTPVSTPITNSEDMSFEESDKSPESKTQACKTQNSSSPGNESVSLETKELREFEMLEKYAENSSFSSDSSVIQRVFQTDKNKNNKEETTQSVAEKILKNPSLNKSSSENSIFSVKFGLNKHQDEIQARKQILQKVMSDINPRIQSLQKEVENCNEESLDDSDISDRCSTPIIDSNTENRVISPVAHDNELNLSDMPVPSVSESNIVGDGNSDINCKCCDVNDVYKDLYSRQQTLKEDDNCEVLQQSDQMTDDRIKIHEKLHELEKEIEIYQEHNAKLSLICKERDEILRKLQKERDDFAKFKEAEKKKLEAEIQEERRQLKRQKETFTRYQKLRKDHPTRKEREEFNALRQEIEKLQEELKRQKIKYTNDCRRLKTQLEAAERERDSFKLENIKLEEQVQDLLTALKARMKKNKVETNAVSDKSEEKCPDVEEHKEVPKQNENITPVAEGEMVIDSGKIQDQIGHENKDPDQTIPKVLGTRKSKGKVRFNLDNESENVETTDTETYPIQENVLKIQDLHHSEKIPDPVDNDECSKKDLEGFNLSMISISVEGDYKEIKLGNKVERIYPSGEREIKFNSGTRKVISADGQSVKFYFYNGDTKEIFPDKRETYKYVNGVIETRFPDGLEITEFPDGQVQRCYPDGQKEVKYPDGTSHNIYADGSEEFNLANGNFVRLSVDGTETIHFANGQKEIRTTAYKRREFPDGSVKIIYESGRQETRYSNGRIRIKDKNGKVIVDTKYLSVSKT